MHEKGKCQRTLARKNFEHEGALDLQRPVDAHLVSIWQQIDNAIASQLYG